jgi:hypothetical protein
MARDRAGIARARPGIRDNGPGSSRGPFQGQLVAGVVDHESVERALTAVLVVKICHLIPGIALISDALKC